MKAKRLLKKALMDHKILTATRWEMPPVGEFPSWCGFALLTDIDESWDDSKYGVFAITTA